MVKFQGWALPTNQIHTEQLSLTFINTLLSSIAKTQADTLFQSRKGDRSFRFFQPLPCHHQRTLLSNKIPVVARFLITV